MTVLFRRTLFRLALIVCVFIIMAAYFLHTTRTIFVEEDEQLEIHKNIDDDVLQPIPLNQRHDKWIVVTSISKPTRDVAKLAAIKGWRVVVVGDVNTPTNWSSSGVEYLSLDDQMRLPYRIVRHLPNNSYTRKNIGYLYAIHHGAKYVYDTDDDNHPTNGRIQFQLKQKTTGLVYQDETHSNVMNPYSHFGQPTIWPRGYPMRAINAPNGNAYTLCTFKTPTIQQGLVNKDPDVDAIFRLTRRKAPGVPFNITFDSRAPPVVLPKGVFAPFNSQNTLFTYDALWALLLPTSVTFRVTDIWRGYWAQRLMWLLGDRLAFFPPNAIQVRNPHDYLSDFVSELQIYMDADRLVTFLKQWRCSRGESSFFKCASQLSREMASAQFWSEEEVVLMDTWLSDLIRVGYSEPSLALDKVELDDHDDVTGDRMMCDFVAQGIRTVYFSPVIQRPVADQWSSDEMLEKSDSAEKLIEFCGDHLLTLKTKARINKPRPRRTNKLSKHDNIVLIIVFNDPFHQLIPMLDTLYSEHFPNMAYCSEASSYQQVRSSMKLAAATDWATHPRDITFINITSTRGYFAYECVMRAMEMNYAVDGYLVVGDDVLFNFWNLNTLQVHYAAYEHWTYGWFPRHKVNSTFYFWSLDVGYNSTNKALDELEHLRRQQPADPLVQEYFANIYAKGLNGSVCLDYSDIYYVPNRKREMFLRIAKVFLRNRSFLELAIPTTIHGLHPTRLGYFNGISLENKARNTWSAQYNPLDIYLHPVKLSRVMSNKRDAKKDYCKTYVKVLLDKVYDWTQ